MADTRRMWIAVALIAALGLGLRIAAAQGALWLDEAWSAVAAFDVGTPLGVFLKINHDNNHHLNTLWLQLVGPHAQPMLQRALPIACGTLAIPVAAAIAARQGMRAAVVAALLFAVSPLLVTYGAEARGYAPMVLALLVAVLLVARWLDDPAKRVPAIPLALAVLLGMFAQLTMVFGLAAIALWTAWVLFRSRPAGEAVRATARILLPVAIPAALAIGLVFGAARAAGTGLVLGNYEPFSLAALGEGAGAMLLAAFGGPLALFAGVVLLAPPDVPGNVAGPARDRLYFLLALAIPLGIAVVQLANSGAPRYLLLCGVGALMLVAMHSGPRLAPRHALRWPVGAALALVIAASLITDWRLVTNRRGDPGLAFRLISTMAHGGGADVAVERPRSIAVLEMMAAAQNYPLEVIHAPCPVTRFLFSDRDGTQPFLVRPRRCGQTYHLIAEGHPTGLSGTHWKLYEIDRHGGQVTPR